LSVLRSCSTVRLVKNSKTAQRWEKTRLQNLVRHQRTGGYYARFFSGGKEIWKALKTTHFSVAEARLNELHKDHKKAARNAVDAGSAKMTFGGALALYAERRAADTEVKESTRKHDAEVAKAVLKSWPELAEREVRRLLPADCMEWAMRYAGSPGRGGKSISATRYNAAIGLVRNTLQLAVEAGVMYHNPAVGLKRRSVKGKALKLPTRKQFAAFVAEIRNGGGRDSRNCADLVEGLAYTGCRIGEAREICWGHINIPRQQLIVHGHPDPEIATKNGLIRPVPLIPAAEALFKTMRKTRKSEPETAKVFLVRECQKSMDRAAGIVGMNRITHHDLRHLFATVCIEAGTDIPTVSRWLGHQDGGALAMKTYGHLRDEHSKSQAAKVQF